MSWQFHVGQKVVCVNDEFEDPLWDEFLCPERNAVYTIRKVEVFNFRDGSEVSLWLEEIVNDEVHWGSNDSVSEVGFWAGRFRPLVEDEFRSEWVLKLKNSLKAGKPVRITEDA